MPITGPTTILPAPTEEWSAPSYFWFNLNALQQTTYDRPKWLGRKGCVKFYTECRRCCSNSSTIGTDSHYIKKRESGWGGFTSTNASCYNELTWTMIPKSPSTRGDSDIHIMPVKQDWGGDGALHPLLRMKKKGGGWIAPSSFPTI